MGKGMGHAEWERAQRHLPYPEQSTVGGYYESRETERQACGLIAGACFLFAFFGLLFLVAKALL